MKNTFTQIKTGPLKFLKLALAFIAMLAFQTNVKAQYPTATHYLGCSWNTGGGSCNQTQFAAIDDVIFLDDRGNRLYRKGPDGCNNCPGLNAAGGHFTLISGTPLFKLEAGGNYIARVSMRNPNNNTNVRGRIAIWIDANGDGDYADANEFLGNTNNVPVDGSTIDIPFSVPCGGSSISTTRIRIRSASMQTDVAYERNDHTNSSINWPNYKAYFGETEDYGCSIDLPSTLLAQFSMPDTAFVGTPVNLVNGNASGYFLHEWDINDDGSIEYRSLNARHVFSTTGTFKVTLKSQNCLGRDSITKSLVIVAPSAPPVVDFAADKNNNVFIGIDDMQFIDLSTNGPTYWEWYMYQPGADSAMTRVDWNAPGFGMFRGNDPFVNKDPFFFLEDFTFIPGVYTVCMRAQNVRGFSSWRCKDNYVDIQSFPDVYMDASTFNIDRNPVTIPTGNLIDEGGRTGNYPNNKFSRALIIPCAAEEISLTFSQLRIRAGDALFVYDGVDARGVPMHPSGGFSQGATPANVGTLVAKSGAMYFEFTSNASANDSGWVATWTTKQGAKTPPVAYFNAPDTIFQGVQVIFENLTTNAVGSDEWEWTVNGTVTSNLRNYSDVFLNIGVPLNVCVEVTSCTGNDKFCKTIPIKGADSRPTKVDFMASERRVKTGEEVSFTAITDNANRFKWTFFPQTATYVNGTDENSQNPQVRFNQAGPYTVSLTAWNYIDQAKSEAKRIRDRFIIVVSFCNPVIGTAVINDVSISYVKLTDNSNKMLIENETEDELAAFTLYDKSAPTLFFGSKYHLAIARPSSVNNMSRRVWVDWNIDGDFDDANETVVVENPSTTDTLFASFTVPDLADAFEGRTRLRIGVSYGNDPNEPCGAASSVRNANRIGEFEDYEVILANDMTLPILVLNGEDTLYLELGSTYTEYGATATDPTEGDISNRVKITDDIDMNLSGIYYVDYTVSDAAGNMAPPLRRVVYVVKDQTPPVLTLNGNDVIRLNVLVDTYNEPGATAVDAQDGDVTTAILISGAVNTDVIGEYTVTYYVQDAQGNGSSKTRTVIVEDVQAPVITNDDIQVIGGENVVQVQLQSIFVDRTQVRDNYYNGVNADQVDLMKTPGAAGDVDTRFKGSYEVTYTATDGSGNNATPLVVKYVVEDYIAPVIALNTLDTVRHPVGSQYTSVQASVSDNLYGPAEISLRRVANVNPFILGLYTEVYTATDASGNVAVKTRFVRVVDEVAPEISGVAGNIVRVGVGSTFDAFSKLVFTDNYDAPAVLRNNAQVTYIDINTYEEGWYSANFVTRDNSGNQSRPFTLLVHVSWDYGVVGLNEVEGANALRVYPNPSNGIVKVDLDVPANEMVNLSVYNVMGAKVSEMNYTTGMNNNFSLDLSNVANGVYTVRAEVAGKVYNNKVVINK